MNELDAALALGEIARARKAVGLPGLTELQAATFLHDLAELRNLPETVEELQNLPETSQERAPVRIRVPVPRKPPRMASRTWLNRQ